MAFIIHAHDDGQPKPFEYLPAGGGLSLVPGTALTTAGGFLALATGETAPSYICETFVPETKEGDIIAVTRADGGRIYETQLAEAAAGIAIGGRLTIDATGGMLTGTAGGSAEVVAFEGNAVGDKVRVRFQI